jgi:S-adenosylmethionine hydrolase
MKGVILTINPNACLIDVTHEVGKFDVRAAAFALASAAPFFPEGTVHLAVVDPGVGTQRRAIVIRAKKGFFVGPDNGVLVLAAQTQGIQHVYQLTNPKFMLPKVSSTFHGRDIFAPAAAYLSKGVLPENFGPEIKDPVMPEFSVVNREDGSLVGEILHIDDFGNIITNINGKEIGENSAKTLKVEMPHATVKMPFGVAYGQAKPQEPIALVGSHGFVEIGLNLGNAAEKFHAETGDKVAITVA